MKHFLTILAIALGTLSLNAQSVTGRWNECTQDMCQHGKLRYFESVSIWQDVDLGGIDSVRRHVRYQYSGEGDQPQNWHTFSGLPDVTLFGNYTFYADLRGLTNNTSEGGHTWNIKIWYTMTNGQDIPALRNEFESIGTLARPGVHMTSTPGPYCNGPSLQYGVQSGVYSGGVNMWLELVVRDAANNMTYTDVEGLVLANAPVQTSMMEVFPWYTGDHCAKVYVVREDNPFYSDFPATRVDSAEIYVPCTFWDGNSTAIIIEPGGITTTSGEGSVDVYDYSGRLVASNSRGVSFATRGWQSGVYIVRLVRDGHVVHTRKISVIN